MCFGTPNTPSYAPGVVVSAAEVQLKIVYSLCLTIPGLWVTIYTEVNYQHCLIFCGTISLVRNTVDAAFLYV